MARLRAPDGCPWDREQTLDTIKKYTLEETYEVFDAIERRDYQDLSEELGDYLLQAVFYAQIASEEGRFTIADSLDAINEKLIRRHPHVFGGGSAETADQVKEKWDEIKKREKPARTAMLDGVARAQPALAEAQQMTSKAAVVGFDWRNADEVLEKMREELAELQEARDSGDKDRIEDEVGDLLFVLVNLSRFLKVDAEQALRRSNTKFRSRFGYIEATLKARGKEWSESNLEEMESLWAEAKKSKSGS